MLKNTVNVIKIKHIEVLIVIVLIFKIFYLIVIISNHHSRNKNGFAIFTWTFEVVPNRHMWVVTAAVQGVSVSMWAFEATMVTSPGVT